MRDTQMERADILVWELVSVRCALGQPLSDETRHALRRQERSLVGALLDLGVLQHATVAPPPPPSDKPLQPLF